jgi:asparagine synthase (glutamine-hydrolysing)
MCGIYGILARSGPVDGAPLAAMDAALRHRGPDDSGTLLDGPCALGMRRLAIIDLEGGRQPIASEDHAVWVVFNGEIYNYRALRRGLQERGHVLTTSSDTEVIVHLYEERGEAFVDELRGMYACAIWNRHTQTLTLARDRLGIKPLYYAETAAGLVFASELRSLLAHPSVGRELDLHALSHYLSFGTTPEERGAVRGVAKLPPGHVARAREGRIVDRRRYWQLPVAHPPPPARRTDGRETVETLRVLLRDAVQSHLESDVPVGAFLSGGVDSATVVALMAQSGQRPHTFSIGFAERDFDELRYARMVAERWDTVHEELVARPDVWSLLDEIVPALDEPFADVSAIPTWLVSRLAARRVKVVLSGDGGDEVFGGYDHYPQGLADARRFDRLPSPLRRALGALSASLPDAAPGKRWLRHASLAARLRFLDGEALFPADVKARLISPGLADALAAAVDPLEERARLLEGAPGDALGRLMWLDTMTYLPLDILTKVDRMSMAHSLEVRPPLLDTPLVEAMARLPSEWKVRGRERKRLFKQAVRGWVPDEILDRPKRGFGVPIREWLRGPLRAAAHDVLLDGRTAARGLFDRRLVRALLDEHVSGRRDQSLRLWALLVLELWTRAVLEGERRLVEPARPRGERLA